MLLQQWELSQEELKPPTQRNLNEIKHIMRYLKGPFGKRLRLRLESEIN